MGGYISSKGVLDQSLKIELSKIYIKQIREIYKYKESKYAECFDLNKSEFQDVFSELLNKWEELYDLVRDGKDKADMYQAFAVLTIFSKDLFKEREQMLFELFDFDQSGDISLPELTLLLTSCINGLSKITHVKTVEFEMLQNLALKGWKVIDSDQSGVIEL